MPFYQAKVYFDGSHYIGIPHTERPTKRTVSPLEETIEVPVDNTENTEGNKPPFDLEIDENSSENSESDKDQTDTETPLKEAENKPKTRKTTRKELFERLYKKYYSLKYWQRKKQIIIDMLPYFDSEDKAQEYVSKNCERMYRNFDGKKHRHKE